MNILTPMKNCPGVCKVALIGCRSICTMMGFSSCLIKLELSENLTRLEPRCSILKVEMQKKRTLYLPQGLFG